MRELVNLFFGKRDVRYTAEHRYCLPLSTEFQTHKNSRNPHFTGFRCTLRRAIDGTRTLKSPGKPIKSRRNAHCLQSVYNYFIMDKFVYSSV